MAEHRRQNTRVRIKGIDLIWSQVCSSVLQLASQLLFLPNPTSSPGVVPKSTSFFFLFIYLFIYLFMATLGLCCCAWAFSSCSEWGLLFTAVRGVLVAVVVFVAQHRL